MADSSHSNNFDVIVVGAGPAGIATAITCAKGGLSVIVIERASIPVARTSWAAFLPAPDRKDYS